MALLTKHRHHFNFLHNIVKYKNKSRIVGFKLHSKKRVSLSVILPNPYLICGCAIQTENLIPFLDTPICLISSLVVEFLVNNLSVHLTLIPSPLTGPMFKWGQFMLPSAQNRAAMSLLIRVFHRTTIC